MFFSAVSVPSVVNLFSAAYKRVGSLSWSAAAQGVTDGDFISKKPEA